MRTILKNQSEVGTMTDQSEEEAETKSFKERDNRAGVGGWGGGTDITEHRVAKT